VAASNATVPLGYCGAPAGAAEGLGDGSGADGTFSPKNVYVGPPWPLPLGSPQRRYVSVSSWHLLAS
jgi:hypothetical protein